MPRLKTAEVADKPGVSQSTVKAQAKLYGITPQIIKNTAYYPENVVDIFKTIASLSETGAGLTTIKKRIGSDVPQPSPAEATPAPDLAQIIPAITEAVQATVERNNDLAEKYARATYRIGELEAEARAYQAQIDAQAEQLAIMPAHGELERLQAELERERAKTWWQKLIGR